MPEFLPDAPSCARYAYCRFWTWANENDAYGEPCVSFRFSYLKHTGSLPSRYRTAYGPRGIRTPILHRATVLLFQLELQARLISLTTLLRRRFLLRLPLSRRKPTSGSIPPPRRVEASHLLVRTRPRLRVGPTNSGH